MTKIFLHGDGNSSVSAWLEAAQDKPPFSATAFALKFAGETGTLVLDAPLTIDADSFKTADGDLEASLRMICEKVHAYGDVPVGKKK